MQELAKANVLVFASVCMEIFGQVWAEAMLLKVPVVASDIGGISEYVKDRGVLFAPGDPKDLAEKIKQVLYNPDLSKIEKAYEFVISECSQDKAYNSITRLYTQLPI